MSDDLELNMENIDNSGHSFTMNKFTWPYGWCKKCGLSMPLLCVGNRPICKANDEDKNGYWYEDKFIEIK